MEKICRICGELKNITEFHKKKGTSDGTRNECKECVKVIKLKYLDKEKRSEYDKVRYEQKREIILERKKEYHIENREEILKKKKEYRKNNPDYGKNYIKNNPEINKNNQIKYRIKYPHIIAWRSVLYSTLKRMGTNKSGHTVDELGYSADELKNHIEEQFCEGMNWENHGEWHIDHIKAVSKFDKDTDIKIVCSLENLQPLWAKENLSKNKY
jgi:hypothetical protein